MYSLTDADHQLIDDTVAALGRVGIFPHQGIEHEDIEDAVSDDLELLRSRPMLTLLGSLDPHNELVFDRVFIDSVSAPRTSLEALLDYISRVSRGAGTSSQLSGVCFFPDAGSTASGSLRFQLGAWDVFDLDYDLAPSLGDEIAEEQLTRLLAPFGTQALTLKDAFSPSPLTIWVDREAAQSTGFIQSLEAEVRA